MQRSKKLFTFLKGESKVFGECPPVQNNVCCQAKLFLAPVEASHLLRDKNVMAGRKSRHSRMRSTGFVPDTVNAQYCTIYRYTDRIREYRDCPPAITFLSLKRREASTGAKTTALLLPSFWQLEALQLPI